MSVGVSSVCWVPGSAVMKIQNRKEWMTQRVALLVETIAWQQANQYGIPIEMVEELLDHLRYLEETRK